MCKRMVDFIMCDGLLYGEKFGFCEDYDHGKKHKGVDFGYSSLLHPSKKLMENEDLGIQLEVQLEFGTPILLGLKDAILDPFKFWMFSSMKVYPTWMLDF